ncbi:uncharacterized protein EI97DRAFT_467142 [Westerdykella ornata]|uniref:CipC-like antibiotic response protein n=1 Tax=Westerdykella ornata TaxID=318751 RepID=A0A6A6JNF4_WESOR|nr:uncharacterized protein EI97DRAFT_467142 [Westerdykella ornata]KAF2276449.1 hypothetical protein EI97DRAFT_467142 [Westerdykella ornata]
MDWDSCSQAYSRVYENGDVDEQKHHRGQEFLAGGMALAGFKAFEDHQRKEGKPISHGMAKDMLAGFAGAEVDKFCQQEGHEWFDHEKAKRHAEEQAGKMYDEYYIQQQNMDKYDPRERGPPPIFGGHRYIH